MLEILFLVFLSKKVGSICENKGRSGTMFKLMLVGLWIGGEIAGFVVGALVTGGNGGAILYLFALIGAAIGAGITFLVAGSLSPVENAPYMMPPAPNQYNSLNINNVNSENRQFDKDTEYK